MALPAAEAPNVRRMNDHISDMPVFYGTAKDTITADHLINRMDASQAAVGWNDQQAYNYFIYALHSKAEEWLLMVQDTNANFNKTWTFIKPLFKQRFGSKIDESKIATTISDIKQHQDEDPDSFASRLSKQFSQIKELIPMGEVADIPEEPEDRTEAYIQAVHVNAIKYVHLQYLRLFYIAGLPHHLMTVVAGKNPTDFTQANDLARRANDLKKPGTYNGTCAIDGAQSNTSEDEVVSQIRGNGTQNPYTNRGGRGNTYRGQSNRGNASRGGGAPAAQARPPYQNPGPGNNQQNNNRTGPTCWYCSILGHTQDECRKRIRENKPCTNRTTGKTYWPKNRAAPVNEETLQENTQGAISGGNNLFQ